MAEREDQRICIQFCFKLGKSSSETVEMMKTAFKEDAMSASSIKFWYSRFKDGRQLTSSDPRSGRPVTAKTPDNIERVRAAIMEDRRLTVRELEDDLGIPKTTVFEILRDELGLRRVSAKFVPRLLSTDQKENRLAVADELFEVANDDPNFMKTVITGDETWVYGYDPETKVQSSQWQHTGSPRPKKARKSRSAVKTMLTVFFDCKGVVHHEYAPPGQAVTKEYYVSVLRRLRDAVRRKRPDLWRNDDWQIHHDNAPAHASRLVQNFLAKHRISQVPQPPYSPDLAPCDFWLFQKLKTPLKGRRFQSVDEIKKNTTKQLMAISKNEFSECFQKWQERWNKCIQSQGDYFEGD
jgi:[histone H3]-lysine36 N-dimethyltransferase SETMAR